MMLRSDPGNASAGPDVGPGVVENLASSMIALYFYAEAARGLGSLVMTTTETAQERAERF